MRLQKLLFPALLVAIVMTAIAGPTFGQITLTSDSTDANWYQYEFDVLPTTQDLDRPTPNGTNDWTFGKSTTPTGTLTVDGTFTVTNSVATADNLFFQSTAAGEIWKQTVNWESGYTFEARLRADTLAPDSHSTLYLQGSSGGSDGNTAGSMLYIAPTGLSWGHGENNTTIDYQVNNDDFHVFRVAQEPGVDSFSVWRDDVLVASEIVSGFNYTNLNRLLFGDGGSGMGGNFEIDYFRFTPEAYKPVNEIIPEYNPPAAIQPSDAFTYQYNMDVDPTDPLAIDLDDNDAPDWINKREVPEEMATIDGNGMLLVPNDAELHSGMTNADGFWPTNGFTAAEGFTYEIRMKVQQDEGTTPNGTVITNATPIAFAPKDTDELVYFMVAADGILDSGANVISEEINDDAQHTFRIARDSNEDGGSWWIWRDGELLTPDGYGVSAIYSRDANYFGPGVGGASSGSLEVDYVRLTTGAFSPVPEPGILTLLALASLSLLALRRKCRN